MTKLNQIVAIEQGEKARANKATAPIFHALKNAANFVGLTRTYEPAEEDGEQYPDESSRVLHTVSELVEAFVKASTRSLDLSATKDLTNMSAKADVVVDGVVLIPDAPVTFLMPFEKYLSQEVRGLVESIPVRDPAQDWTASDSERGGISETGTVKKAKGKKITEPLTLAPATDKHPAQVQLVNRDVVAGYWSEKKFSGAVSAQAKQELLDRVETLIQAVKFAREKANDTEVVDMKVGAAVFGYLFA